METTNASEEKIFQMVKAGEKQKNGAADKNIVHPIEYAFKELKTDNAYEAIGCAIAIDCEGLTGHSGRYRLGVAKFYLPKWERLFVHMFSPEEGVTEFASLPKALKFVKSCNMNGDDIEVDFSRLCKDRFWLSPAELPRLQWLSDKPVWSRIEAGSHSPKHVKDHPDWKQCSECKYLIDEEEPSLACSGCFSDYHSDCLLKHEKLSPPSFDISTLDQQAKKYLLASKKWKARKTSKNPSLVIEDEEENKTNSSEDKLPSSPSSQPLISPPDSLKFTCLKCRDCRYCCTGLNEEIIPSIPNPPSIQPFVVCVKCNSAFHGHCGFPQVPKLHASVEWQCDDCRQCNSCHRITYLNESTGQPSLLTEWALPSFDQCKQCFAGLDKGEYCPVCMKAWTIEWGGDMVQCDSCEFWVHTLCDDLNTVSVSKLGKTDVKYNCPICRDTTDIHRRRRVIDLLRAIDKIALFSEPVSAAFLPVYLKVIKQPMDLSKMRAKNESGYESNIDFIADFELIVANAKIFNMPNSPAFRLAEQFHKQGKLLIEKYLLNDKKGASKIEGLVEEEEKKEVKDDEMVIDMDMVHGPSSGDVRPSRQASIQAAKTWTRPATINQSSLSTNSKKSKSLTYNDVLEIIKKRGGNVIQRPPPPALDDTEFTAGGGSGETSIISPYRKRRLSGGHAFGSPIPTTKPSSGAASPLDLQFPMNSNSALLSESDILAALISIFGLKDAWYVLNGFKVMDDRRVVEGKFFPLPATVLEEHSSNYPKTEVEQISKIFRWSLFESCNICNSYSDPWNIIFCSHCGESMHYYCSGLVVHPSNDHHHPINPISQRPSKSFKCATCCPPSSCRCGLCGNAISNDEDDKASSYKLEICENSMSVNLCSDCVIDQVLRVFKSNACAECSGTIQPCMATSLMKILNPNEPVDTSTRTAPLVHCVGCGLLWHARCLKEFSDLTNADIVGLYICDSCRPNDSLVTSSETSTDISQTLSTMGSFLSSFKPGLYRDVLIECAVQIFSQSGLYQGEKNSLIGQSSLNDLLDIFLAASGAPVSVSASALLTACKSEELPKLEQKDREWIKWGLIHKDLLLALAGMSVTDLNNKRKFLDPSGGGVDKSSVKFKRMEDEDLLFAKRIDRVGNLLRDLQSMMETTSSDGHDKMADLSASLVFPLPSGISVGDMGSNAVYTELMHSGEKGAVLCKLWLKKYGLNGGYSGPCSTLFFKPELFCPLKSPRLVPEWDTRTCVLCSHRGDQIVMGGLLPYTNPGKEELLWVHSECLRWSLTRDFSVPPNWIDPIHAVPSPGRPIAPPQKPVIISSTEVSQIVARATRDDGGVFCTVCDKTGASVYCQQCSTSAYHFACALSVNELVRAGSTHFTPMSNRVVMDTRCSLLTCGKCLYRNNQLDKWFESEFECVKFKQNQSVYGQVMGMVRLLRPIVIESGDPGYTGDLTSRGGSLTILKCGNFPEDYMYDGRRELVPFGFVSVRIFSSLDVPITDDIAHQFGTLVHKDDKPALSKQHRCAYMCKISEDGNMYTISVIGGRTLGVGKSLDECFTSFKEMFELGRSSPIPDKLDGAWFFGLTSERMRDYLNHVARKSVKKQASIRREKWMYHPQLRPVVISALGLDSDLKPISSFRRNLNTVSTEAAACIDQLQSLGREKFVGSNVSVHDMESGDHELLDPNMVIVEWVGGEDSTTKPSRSVMSGSSGSQSNGATVGPSSGFASKYKVRTAIVDSELLNVKRSKIHNYGLFAKNGFAKGEFVVEYQGEVLRETIADEREKRAERAGNGDGGSCYMFRLDEDHVIDATLKGNCARFINHSCNPNCSCRLVEDENRKKHIMIVAKRDIAAGEEITYDYQFAVESEKLACLCGAANCLGRLN